MGILEVILIGFLGWAALLIVLTIVAIWLAGFVSWLRKGREGDREQNE